MTEPSLPVYQLHGEEHIVHYSTWLWRTRKEFLYFTYIYICIRDLTNTLNGKVSTKRDPPLSSFSTHCSPNAFSSPTVYPFWPTPQHHLPRFDSSFHLPQNNIPFPGWPKTPGCFWAWRSLPCRERAGGGLPPTPRPPGGAGPDQETGRQPARRDEASQPRVGGPGRSQGEPATPPRRGPGPLTSSSLWLRIPRTRSCRFLSNMRSMLPFTIFSAMASAAGPGRAAGPALGAEGPGPAGGGRRGSCYR